MLWFRRPPPTVTNEAYHRWLRAGSPPWLWFLERSEVEQEALAMIGDEVQRDRALAIGYAVTDPQSAELGAAAQSGDVAAEASLARNLAAQLAAKIAAQAPRQPSRPAAQPQETFGGFGGRRVAAEPSARPRRFLGRTATRGGPT